MKLILLLLPCILALWVPLTILTAVSLPGGFIRWGGGGHVVGGIFTRLRYSIPAVVFARFCCGVCIGKGGSLGELGFLGQNSYGWRGGGGGVTREVGPYITLAIGSAMALFMYPHALTGALAASSGRAIRFNTMTLSAYSFILGLIAMLGLMAIAAGVKAETPQDAVPQLVLWAFPSWFAGFCFAAIALGALVPAAVMSIGAANTFTRNIWRPYVHPETSPREESFLAKLASLAVKIGALAVIFFMPTRFALDLQLLGGVWVVQIFPAVIFGLYTRWFSGWALLIGWAAGMTIGTSLSWSGTAWVPVHTLGWDIPLVGNVDLGLGFAAYNGLTAIIVNMLLSTALSMALRSRAHDETSPADYEDRAPA